MPQTPTPILEKKKPVYRIKTTITIPEEWVEPIRNFMEEKGFQDYAELIRYLIRTAIIEKKVE